MIKFNRRKMELPEGKIVVYHEHAVAEKSISAFTLVASREGVGFQGDSLVLRDRQELDAFAKALTDAWKDHRSLLPKLIAPGEGH